MNSIRLTTVLPKNRKFPHLTRNCSINLQNEAIHREPYTPPPEYTSEPKYPKILDVSRPKVRERKKEDLHEQIKNVKTVEEKQIKINMPRYYGFKSYMFRDDAVPYNSLPLAQHITRTCVVESGQLHGYYGQFEAAAGKAVEELKGDIEDVVRMECTEKVRRRKIEGQKSDESGFCCSLVEDIGRLVANKLASNVEYLKSAQIDLSPRVESSWFAGGMIAPLQVQRYRKNHPYSDQSAEEPTDRAIQYLSNPILTVRSEQPLRPIIPYGDAQNESLIVPYFRYDPRVNDTVTTHRHLTNIPGFWPGDPAKFGLLKFCKNARRFGLMFDDAKEYPEAIQRQAVLAGFGWLNAIANHLGFTTFNDVTYPLVTQIVITDGQYWSFATYQLNTLLVHSKNTTENPLRNICWVTPEMKLFDGAEQKVNLEVVKNLVKFYLNEPKERLGVNMTPYLSDEAKVGADYKDDDKTTWLEKNYKHYMANKGWHIEIEQVYAWEKIYKLDHKTRPMDKKLKMFELKMKKAQDRKLHERLAEYVPRCKRPDLPKNKGRYKKEYFPL